MTIRFQGTITEEDKAPLILWDNVYPKGTLTTTTGNGSNAINYATNDFWSPTALPASITVDLGVSTTVDTLAFAAHDMGSAGCSITLERFVGGSWFSLFTYAITDNEPFLVSFDSFSATMWRVTITGSTNPNIGVIFLGESLRFPEGVTAGYVPMYMAENIETLTAQTITGQFMPNRIQRRGLSTSFTLNVLDRNSIESTDFQRFRRYYNDGGSFFFAANPDELREDLSYCWKQGDSTLKPELGNIFYTLEMSLEGFLA